MEIRKKILQSQSPDELNSFLKEQTLYGKEVLIWQTGNEDSRIKCNASLKEVSISDKIISLSAKDDSDTSSFKNDLVYIHFLKVDAICKAQLKKINGDDIIINIPEEIRFIGSTSTNKITDKMTKRDLSILNKEIELTRLDAEDLEFAGMREAPRMRPKSDKLVEIRYTVDNVNKEASYVLHDLSQGGIGMLVIEKDDLTVGMELEILSLDNSVFDIPMRGIIRAITDADNMGVQYKVGVQFIQN